MGPHSLHAFNFFSVIKGCEWRHVAGLAQTASWWLANNKMHIPCWQPLAKSPSLFIWRLMWGDVQKDKSMFFQSATFPWLWSLDWIDLLALIVDLVNKGHRKDMLYMNSIYSNYSHFREREKERELRNVSHCGRSIGEVWDWMVKVCWESKEMRWNSQLEPLAWHRVKSSMAKPKI